MGCSMSGTAGTRIVEGVGDPWGAVRARGDVGHDEPCG
jgi:hypothetical protein